MTEISSVFGELGPNLFEKYDASSGVLGLPVNLRSSKSIRLFSVSSIDFPFLEGNPGGVFWRCLRGRKCQEVLKDRYRLRERKCCPRKSPTSGVRARVSVFLILESLFGGFGACGESNPRLLGGFSGLGPLRAL